MIHVTSKLEKHCTRTVWLCEKNGAFVFVSFWFRNDPILAFVPFLLLKSKSKSCSSDGKVTSVWPFLTLTCWDGCFSSGLNQINPYVYIFFYLFFFFSLLPAPKINVASGGTFCFSPEKKKKKKATDSHTGFQRPIWHCVLFLNCSV